MRCLLLLLLLLLLFLAALPAGRQCECLKRQQEAAGAPASQGSGNLGGGNGGCRSASRRQERALEPQPAGSIFGSLLGGDSASGDAGADQTALDQLISSSAQQSGFGRYRRAGRPDRVVLEGDVLLGGLFPIHNTGK